MSAKSRGPALVVLAFSALACKKPAPAPAPQPGAEVSARPSAQSNRYRAAIALAGACRHGESCTAEVSLEPRSDLHVNPEYPIKFKLSEPLPPGVRFAKTELARADGSIAPSRAVLRLGFVPEAAGDVPIAGVLSLSVCSDANCFIDKAPLSAVAKVE